MNQTTNFKSSNRRLKIIIQGAVQGVGFRPFVFRLAESLDLTGWVINSSQGVLIEAEGTQERLNAFLLGLEKEKPPLAAFSHQDLKLLPAIFQKRINSHITSSLGRIFDAVASILGLQQYSQFEGQAAMALEFLTDETDTAEVYPIDLSSFDSAAESSAPPLIVDWEPMIRRIIDDISDKIPNAVISAKFHNTLADAAVQVAKKAGEEKVLLSGGCFQNRYLTERTVKRLTEEGFAVYWHQRIPPNDGGIFHGQAVGAAIRINTSSNNPKT